MKIVEEGMEAEKYLIHLRAYMQVTQCGWRMKGNQGSAGQKPGEMSGYLLLKDPVPCEESGFGRGLIYPTPCSILDMNLRMVPDHSFGGDMGSSIGLLSVY